jgi:hypothetical protein
LKFRKIAFTKTKVDEKEYKKFRSIKYLNDFLYEFKFFIRFLFKIENNFLINCERKTAQEYFLTAKAIS